MRKFLFLLILIVGFSVVMVGCSNNDASGDTSNDTSSDNSNDTSNDAAEEESTYPEDNMDWTIAFGPGGGNDVMARTIISIMEKYDMYPGDLIPENREGGSGAIGWGYVHKNAGDPYQISTTSGSFLTTPLKSETDWDYSSFTHIALMAADDLFFLVKGNSEYETLEDFIKAAEGKTMNIGGIGVANVDRMIVETFAEETGLDLEYVSFNAEGQLQSALLSDSLDAMVANPNGVVGQLESGDMRALAFTGRTQLSDFPDVPTFIDEGYDINISMPRGLILAADVDEEVRQWWIDAMKEVAETDEWGEYINKNYLTETILYGDEFTEYLDETSDVFNTILGDLGVLED